jgi:hypothetical protein
MNIDPTIQSSLNTDDTATEEAEGISSLSSAVSLNLASRFDIALSEVARSEDSLSVTQVSPIAISETSNSPTHPLPAPLEFHCTAVSDPAGAINE